MNYKEYEKLNKELSAARLRLFFKMLAIIFFAIAINLVLYPWFSILVLLAAGTLNQNPLAPQILSGFVFGSLFISVALYFGKWADSYFPKAVKELTKEKELIKKLKEKVYLNG